MQILSLKKSGEQFILKYIELAKTKYLLDVSN